MFYFPTYIYLVESPNLSMFPMLSYKLSAFPVLTCLQEHRGRAAALSDSPTGSFHRALHKLQPLLLFLWYCLFLWNCGEKENNSLLILSLCLTTAEKQSRPAHSLAWQWIWEGWMGETPGVCWWDKPSIDHLSIREREVVLQMSHQEMSGSIHQVILICRCWGCVTSLDPKA